MVHAPIDPRLLPRTTILGAHDVTIGSVSLQQLAEEFGTPLFIYDEQSLRDRCREAVRAFPDGIAFASKSFLCGAMARLVVEEGLFIDVATAGELDLVLRSGVPGSRIVMHGNNKSRDEISRAHEAGVHRFVIDNFDEISRLREIVTTTRPLDCLLRVIPGVEAHTHEFVKTGHEDTKFGLSILTRDAARAVEQLRQIPGINLLGFHAHIGSQIFEVDAYDATMSVLAAFVDEHGAEEICVGGGLGVPYVVGEFAPSLTEWGEEVRASATRHLAPHVRVTAEPGRAIVAAAAVTLYRVGARKTVAERTYLAVDGGMSDNPRPVLYGSGYEAFLLSNPLSDRDSSFRIVGKHCESGDVLIDEAWLPQEVSVGDIVVTPVTGAYGYSMASNYNRVPRPAVVFVIDGRARVVLRRETLEDLSRLEN